MRRPIARFRADVPLAETMMFEDCYEPELQMTLAQKRRNLAGAIVVWMFLDDAIAGETYGSADPADPRTIYCNSTTILPAFQGHGYGRILCAYWLGLVRGAGFARVAGHATSPAMTAVKASFGAEFSTVTEGWFGTTRTARYYTLAL